MRSCCNYKSQISRAAIDPLHQEMELLILSKLKWDLSAVTPYDFLEHLIRLLQVRQD